MMMQLEREKNERKEQREKHLDAVGRRREEQEKEEERKFMEAVCFFSSFSFLFFSFLFSFGSN